QFDYLRRLARHIREEHERLRREENSQGFTSIGVFGTDLYDKLLVLQAIRHEFRSATFFTTDLDARYLDPRDLPWTRNLLVASSYGLQLRNDIQGEIPPFRNSYQTATFLAARVALSDADAARKRATLIEPSRIANWLGEPRLYEIGRTEAVDLSRRENA